MDTKFRSLDLLLVCSLTVSLGLAYELHVKGRAEAAIGPSEGSIAGLIAGVEDSGRAKALSVADGTGRDTVIYVFSQTCPWCEKTTPVLQSLIAAEKDHYRFVALDLSQISSPSEKYLQQNKLDFEAVFRPDRATRQRLGLGGTPETFVMDQTGKVTKSFRGAFQGDTLDSINNYFKISLTGPVAPGITEPNQCVADGFAFSVGARICWEQEVYTCSARPSNTVSWERSTGVCLEGTYVANKGLL